MKLWLVVFVLIFGLSNCIDGNGKENFILMEWSHLQQLQEPGKDTNADEVTDDDDDLDLDYDTVARIASLPLHCHSVEYPNKLQQVLQNETELLSPAGD